MLPLAKLSLKTKLLNVLLFATLLMPRRWEISKKLPPTKSTNFLSSILRCTTALKLQSISALFVVVPRWPVGFAPLRRGNLCAKVKWIIELSQLNLSNAISAIYAWLPMLPITWGDSSLYSQIDVMQRMSCEYIETHLLVFGLVDSYLDWRIKLCGSFNLPMSHISLFHPFVSNFPGGL